MRLIASPSSRATLTVRSFLHVSAFSRKGIVSVTQTSTRGGLDAIERRAREHAVGGAGIDRARAGIHRGLGSLSQSARGVDHVVDDDGVLALHVADDVHDFADVRSRAALVDDRQRCAETLGIGACTLDAAGIRRDDDGRSRTEPARACTR